MSPCFDIGCLYRWSDKNMRRESDYIPWAPKTMKTKGFGHLKTRLFTIKTSKNVGFGGPWYLVLEIFCPDTDVLRGISLLDRGCHFF